MIKHLNVLFQKQSLNKRKLNNGVGSVVNLLVLKTFLSSGLTKYWLQARNKFLMEDAAYVGISQVQWKNN